MSTPTDIMHLRALTGRPLCGHYKRSRWLTDNADNVTCPRCRKRLEELTQWLVWNDEDDRRELLGKVRMVLQRGGTAPEETMRQFEALPLAELKRIWNEAMTLNKSRK